MELANDMLLKIVPFVFLVEKQEFCGGGPGVSGGKKMCWRLEGDKVEVVYTKATQVVEKTGKCVFSQT